MTPPTLRPVCNPLFKTAEALGRALRPLELIKLKIPSRTGTLGKRVQ